MRSKWKELQFTEAVEVNPKVFLEKGHEYPFVDMKAVDPSWQNVSESEYRVFKSGGARFMPYDTLMARITPCLENGKLARFVPKVNNDGPAFGSTEFIIIRGREGVTENDFSYYLTKWQEFRNFAVSQMTGSSGRQRVPADSLADFSVPIPELDDQRAIAHILGSLDDKIELNRKMNETLEAMARAIFKSWFVDFDPVHAKTEGRDPGLPKDIADLFPDSFQDSDLGEIPKGWEIKTIGEVVRCVGGSTPSTKNPTFWDGGTDPFVTPKDMSSLTSPVILDTARHITDTGVDKISSGRLPAGTVLLSSRAPIGYLAITEVPVSVNQGIIAMICDKALPNYHVLYWIEANMDTIKSNAGGTTFAEISKRNFRPIQVIVPHERVLEAYVLQIEPLHQQVVLNLQESNTLASLRDTLLPKLISGDLHVPEAKKLLDGLNINGGQHG
jgi:type I restriction enzyme, S subunit